MFESLRQDLVDGEAAEGSLHPRPAIPFLLICAGCLWSSIALYEMVSWRLLVTGRVIPFTPVLSALLAAIAVCIVSMIHGRGGEARGSKLLSIPLLLFCAGILFAHLFWQGIQGGRQRVEEGIAGKHTYLICDDARKGEYGFRSEALIYIDGRRIPLAVYWRNESDIQPAGSLVEAYGTVKASKLDVNGMGVYRNGRCGSVTLHSSRFVSWGQTATGIVAPYRQRIIADLSAFSGEGAALLQGVLVGERSRIDGTDTERDFQDTGLAHLIAVSGSHLAVVSSLLLWLLALLGVSRRPTFALLSLSLLCYLLLSGLQVSALRACLMTEVGMFALFDERRKDTRAALGLSICLILAADPSAAFSFSFGLSVLAVCGICFLAPLFQDWLALALPRSCRRMAQPIALTLAAQFACLPLTIPTFSVISTVSPLSNILIAPLFDLLLGLGLAAALASPLLPALAHLLYTAATRVGGFICAVVGVLSEIPFASLAVDGSALVCVALTVAGFVLLWAFWPKPSRRGLFFLCAGFALLSGMTLVPYALPSSPRLVVLDVGQGDSLLISSGYHHLLIDAGEDRRVLERALARNHVRDLDAVIVTHLHSDHYGGLEGIGQSVHMGEAFIAQPLLERYPNSAAVNALRAAAGSSRLSGLEVGDHLSCGPFDMEVVSPSKVTDKGGNQDSLCLRLSYDGNADGVEDASALLCGDAESQTTAALAGKGLLGAIDVLKVGHHGSAVSLDDTLLTSLDIRLAIISVGEGNSYGHPDPATLEQLEARGIPIRRTDRNGDVVVRFSLAGIRATCSRTAAA